MEGVWRCSDVGRATSWYCSTYKGEETTPKCSFLSTSFPLFLTQTTLRPSRFAIFL